MNKISSIKYKRAIAFIIDLMIIGGLGAILGITNLFNNDIISIFLLILLLLKELPNGQSFGKKITKIEIRSKHTYEMKFFLLIIRNISLLLWPVEAFMVLIFNNRIMDLLTRTIVVSSEYPADGSL